MAWKDLPVGEKIERSWREIGRGFAERDFLKVQKYVAILANTLRHKTQLADESTTGDEDEEVIEA